MTPDAIYRMSYVINTLSQKKPTTRKSFNVCGLHKNFASTSDLSRAKPGADVNTGGDFIITKSPAKHSLVHCQIVSV